ncbi:hypothetical protein T492DRAFT_384380 [Pavlovales sp. CCMP2436]|nr:hypothetical protein T492DRAFT_384380 [Pavlovales sp. CCMP2436]
MWQSAADLSTALKQARTAAREANASLAQIGHKRKRAGALAAAETEQISLSDATTNSDTNTLPSSSQPTNRRPELRLVEPRAIPQNVLCASVETAKEPRHQALRVRRRPTRLPTRRASSSSCKRRPQSALTPPRASGRTPRRFARQSSARGKRRYYMPPPPNPWIRYEPSPRSAPQ